MSTMLPRQWDARGLLPVAAGVYWLVADAAPAWLIWAWLPGVLLTGAGFARLTMPYDPRPVAMLALGGALGVLLLPLAWIVGGLGTAFYTTLASLGVCLLSGRIAWDFDRARAVPEEPEAERSTTMDAKIFLDELMLGVFLAAARFPSGEAAREAGEQMLALAEGLRGAQGDGWREALLAAPPQPEEAYVERARLFGRDYEVLRFDSAYQPPLDMPGAQAWMSLPNNDQCHVRIFRHKDGHRSGSGGVAPRPWLLCIHGFRMGPAAIDLSMFSPQWLHDQMGFNLIQPVLPLHGPRRVAGLSGTRYLDGNLVDSVHAQAQALSDLRQALAWLRASEPDARIGVFGVSLGGYNAALLANHEAGLDFVLAGIPLVDMAAVMKRFLPLDHQAYMASIGFDDAAMQALLAPVSPLSRAPLLAADRRHIIAAAGDAIVHGVHPLRLSAHWGVPVQWYQGSHMSVRSERATRHALRLAAQSAGWPLR